MRVSSQTKAGAPITAVTIPTGTSAGAAITRARLSDSVRSVTPSSALAGRTSR